MMIIHSWKDNNKIFFCDLKRNKEEKDAVVPIRFLTTLFDAHATQRPVHTIPNRNTRQGVQRPRIKENKYGYTMRRNRQDRDSVDVIIIGSVDVIIGSVDVIIIGSCV